MTVLRLIPVSDEMEHGRCFRLLSHSVNTRYLTYQPKRGIAMFATHAQRYNLQSKQQVLLPRQTAQSLSLTDVEATLEGPISRTNRSESSHV